MREEGGNRWHRRELKRAALAYVEHGWSVVPAAYFDGEKYVCVQMDCGEEGPHPVWRMWHERATTDPASVSSWYRLFVFGIALPTGSLFDVLEVPEPWGARVQAALTAHGPLVPSAVWAERGCRLFWVQTGTELPEQLISAGFRMRSTGSWAPAPPSPTRYGPIRWVVDAERAGWRPGASSQIDPVLAMLTEQLDRMRLEQHRPSQVG